MTGSAATTAKFGAKPAAPIVRASTGGVAAVEHVLTCGLDAEGAAGPGGSRGFGDGGEGQAVAHRHHPQEQQDGDRQAGAGRGGGGQRQHPGTGGDRDDPHGP